MSKFNFCYADMLQSANIDLFYSGFQSLEQMDS